MLSPLGNPVAEAEAEAEAEVVTPEAEAEQSAATPNLLSVMSP